MKRSPDGPADLQTRFAPFHVTVENAAWGMDGRARRLESIPETLPVLVLRKPEVSVTRS